MMVDFDDVTYTYRAGTSPVLHGLTGGVARGERVALVGPSGSGKTTLLMLVWGILAPTSGVMHVATDDAVWVHQDPRTFPLRSLRDNVALGAMHSGSRWSDARRDAVTWLVRLGIGHLAEGTPVAVSGGERQRTCLARALATRSELLLLDEPTAQLDHHTAVAAVGAFLGACGPERTVIAATHDTSIVDHFDRVVELADGRFAP